MFLYFSHKTGISGIVYQFLTQYLQFLKNFIFLIENLLLTVDHKTVKLVDFGLAREETLTEMMTAETGTYRWMAPEVVIFTYVPLVFILFTINRKKSTRRVDHIYKHGGQSHRWRLLLTIIFSFSKTADVDYDG